MTDIMHCTSHQDVFRNKYQPVTENEAKLIDQINEEAQMLWSSLNYYSVNYENGKREIAIAKTKLEEVVMWAVKGISSSLE